ncbi:hypothetical protein [Salinisphaera sp. Q1T1-3]|uniref:hypothetical protein n=1 Tax=Salinisphaera sp. Q1T1-3 TaxID=2321229 RepID=UPI000E7143E6|nr:hypothetical protein [Salinisphaera sp. Q1T1-3]RJS94772.1 hypothetical protein D3260_03110 [Salinisphaera sp. Q1T1-3]
MRDMTVETAFDTRSEASERASWALAHPVWSRIGALLDRAAVFCGTHGTGYVAPVRINQA